MSRRIYGILPINVQDTYEGVLLSRDSQCRVYPGDDAVKQVGVDLLGEGISGIHRLHLGHRLHHRLRHQDDPAMTQPTHQLVCSHTQQLTEDRQMRISRLKD